MTYAMLAGVKVGDRIRVVFEDKVINTGEDFIGTADWFLEASDKTIISVEALPEPLKVGDMLDTVEQLEALPVGAVVIGNKFGTDFVNRRTFGGFELAGDAEEYAADDLDLPVKVLHLPDAAVSQ